MFLIQFKGIICYGEDLVGWRSIARSWLESRTQSEIQVLFFKFNYRPILRKY